MIIGEIDIPDQLLEAKEEVTFVIFVGAGDYPAVFRRIFHKGKCRLNDNRHTFINGQVREKGSQFLLSHVGGVRLVVEQDKPFDPLNIGRNHPGTVITGTHQPFLPGQGAGAWFDIANLYLSLSQVV